MRSASASRPGHDGTVRKMARPEGFEPPTNGFGSHYSIRLSYGRVAGHYARAAGRAVLKP